MTENRPTHLSQKEHWNGRAGQVWVETQDILDRLFKPFEDHLCQIVQTTNARNILDIGCGTGSTTNATAHMLEDRNGRCTGIDISGPMIEAAQKRTYAGKSRPHFINADAQSHPFRANSFDMLISRFGVMFFSNYVEAMSNLHRAATGNARLAFIAWRSPEANPFMTTAEKAAAPFLPQMPKREPGAPGQFAFAGQYRVADILKSSGWTNIDIQPIDVSCTLTESDLMTYITHLGPLGLLLPGMTEEERTPALQSVRAAFDPFMDGTTARFTAACWMIQAQAS